MLTCNDQVKIFKLYKYRLSLGTQSPTLKSVAVGYGATGFVRWLSDNIYSKKYYKPKIKNFQVCNCNFKNFLKKV
jgi:hypothetical protein